jgi:acetylglutamate kinase
MAVSCASGFSAERLLFLTDVEGVRTADGRIAQTLTPAEIDRLIANGVAAGGMQAKLEAAKLALHSGVGEIVIALGQAQGVVGRLASGERVGTRIVREEPA